MAEDWRARCRARGGVPVNDNPNISLFNPFGRADACRFVVDGKAEYRSPEKTFAETIATVVGEATGRWDAATSDVVLQGTGIVEDVAALPATVIGAAVRSPLAWVGLAGLAIVFLPEIRAAIKAVTK